MSYIIDRRLNSKNKSTVNRQRFLKRYRKQIRKAVSDAISERKLTDMKRSKHISIPEADTTEPVFGHSQGGENTIIHPGNKEFITGDKIPRPAGGGKGGSGSGQGSDSGEGIDDFVFQISQQEFLEYMFEDLELPNMVKQALLNDDLVRFVQGGISEVGNPNKINIVRSLRSAHARRIALGAKSRKRRKELLGLLEQLQEPLTDQEQQEKLLMEDEVALLTKKINKLPFIDEFDLKYNLRIQLPQPSPKAVMFCLMDVSGSMTQEIKDTAKRFFFLLYLFLQRNYKKIDVVFIRHHTQADEVDEETFFYSRETGGTVVSSALKLMDSIIKDRYSPAQWNIYAAQASDGDNWQGDNERCQDILSSSILPMVQYFTYIEIGDNQAQDLWDLYEQLQSEHSQQFAIRKVTDNSEIFPVFHELFQKRGLA